MAERLPYTRHELNRMFRTADKKRKKYEEKYPEARPLPPMTEDECQEMFYRILDIAAERALTLEECFLHGQLLAQYRSAVWGTARGYKGRVFVVHEEALDALLKDKKGQ